ncbi:MAG: pyridoxal phosphate-dependent aminotransferase [bacterium]
MAAVQENEVVSMDIERNIAISERARTMQGSPIRKLAAVAEARKKTGIKVFHLNIGQPDLPTHPVVFETIQQLRLSTLAYAPSNGLPQALKAWKTYYQHLGIEVDESEIIITTGGSEAIIFAMCAVCDTGDEIIVFEPFYTNYNGFASIANVKLRPLSLAIENGFHLPSTAEIEKEITPRSKAILICNPANPTGTVLTKAEMHSLVAIVKQHNLFLLSDEVYREFAYEGERCGVMSFPEIVQQAIMLDSSSKRFNVCGARIGTLVSHNKEIVHSALKMGMARLSVASIEQLALIPLLEDSPKYVQPIVEEFRQRRDVVFQGLKEIPGVTYYKPEGAFYIVIGLPVKDSEHFAKWLIQDYEHQGETVLLAPAQGFYATPGKGTNEVRIAFMLKSEDLKKSLNILKHALEAYNKLF